MYKLRIYFLVLLFVFFILGYFYFFQFSPIIEKPSIISYNNENLDYNKVIENESIENEEILLYNLLNLFEAYKLHNPIFSEKKPYILIITYNGFNSNNDLYLFTINENKIILELKNKTDFLDKNQNNEDLKKSLSKILSSYNNLNNINIDNNQYIESDNINQIDVNNLDLVIFIDKNSLKRVNSSDLKAINLFINEQKIVFRILADEKTLFLKGYKVIYDKFNNLNNNQITGNFLFKRPLRPMMFFDLIFIIIFSVFVGLFIERQKY